MEISCISNDDILRIAKHVFGDAATVGSVREIVPSSEHGVMRVCGCNWNLSYVVSIGDRQKYVFRFNRRRYGRGDETIEIERRNYDLIAENTDIPTPRIYQVDTSRSIVPTGYIVMDYMIGDSYSFLTDPRNPSTSGSEKQDIHREAGYSYAQVHKITQPAKSVEATAERLLGRLDQLEQVVRNTHCRVTPELIGRCRKIVMSDPSLLLDTESLCIADGDLCFAKSDGEWKASFICDLEWSGYGDPHFDLLGILSHPEPFWALKSPLGSDRVQQKRDYPFFRGYEDIRKIDYGKLCSTAIYAHLAGMCSIARELYKADEREGIEAREPSIYFDLLQAIVEKR